MRQNSFNIKSELILSNTKKNALSVVNEDMAEKYIKIRISR